MKTLNKLHTLRLNKDFLNLLKGDIVSISTDGDGRIYFNVENRTHKVRFYGNKHGKWGKNNPYSEDQPKFILIDEPIGYKTVIEFSYIPYPEPHPTKEFNFADDAKTTENWIDKIINDLKLIGVV